MRQVGAIHSVCIIVQSSEHMYLIMILINVVLWGAGDRAGVGFIHRNLTGL